MERVKKLLKTPLIVKKLANSRLFDSFFALIGAFIILFFIVPELCKSLFNYEFEYIHPFMDGNGRLGRLWQTLILSKWQPIFLDLPLESVIKQHQQDYYNALAESDKVSNSTEFIVFMLNAILKTITKNATVNATVNLEGMNTSEAIIALIENSPSITRQKMALLIGKNISTIARAIKKLQQQNILKRIGSDKTGHWQLL